MKMFNRTTGFLIAQLVFVVAVIISLKGNMYIGMFLMAVATACAIIFFGNDNNDDNYYKLT